MSVFTIDMSEAKRTGNRHRRYCSRRCSKLGNLNPRWKGNTVSINAGRSRARRHYKEIGPCVKCGSVLSERHHKDGNTLNNNRDNIEPVCRRCHMRVDGRLVAISKTLATVRQIGVTKAAILNRGKTHCKYGHEFSTENTYMDKNGSRSCRVCRKKRSDAYHAINKH